MPPQGWPVLERPAPPVLPVLPGPVGGWPASEQLVRAERPPGQRLLEAPVRSGDETYLLEVRELLRKRLERRPVERLVQMPLAPQPQDWRLLEPKQQGSPAAGERQTER
jgi:hypothetical protein